MKYRSDIDGLRAIAVLSVILFHSGVETFSGGFIGVDVFFVISGYLITTLIYQEMKDREFTFAGFYKRRAARILPSLSLTLLLVLVFGFIFYNNHAFDNLGKEVFFSSLGAVNIHFSHGVDYFANDEAYRPLIHLWSLGVEEQFYILWPIILLVTFRFPSKVVIFVALTLFIISLWLSISAVEMGLTKGYFLIQYRAFELLIGATTSLVLFSTKLPRLSKLTKQSLTYIGLSMVLVPVFVLDNESTFPGFNALWPCIGTAILIACPGKGLLTKVLSQKKLVGVGLISYPLYLYHQPIISFLSTFQVDLTPLETFVIVTSISTPLSWLTYKYIETPIRKLARIDNRKISYITILTLVATIPFFAIIGIAIAKTGGLEERFKYLNPFALEVGKAHSTTFHQNFERGYKVTPIESGRVLFVGDSVLQHYVLPVSVALNFEDDDIDTVTRGGCVLLKGVDFVDKFSDISCDDIRRDLYDSKKTYDYVIISQGWSAYDSSVTNFSKNTDKYGKWIPFLDATIEHFSHLTDNIIVIGAHPSVHGTLKLQPSITISEDTFLSSLEKLYVTNINDLRDSVSFFENYAKEKNIEVIHPYNIFCNDGCITNDGMWSYFSDTQHVSTASTRFITQRLNVLLKTE